MVMEVVLADLVVVGYVTVVLIVVEWCFVLCVFCFGFRGISTRSTPQVAFLVQGLGDCHELPDLGRQNLKRLLMSGRGNQRDLAMDP